MVLEELASIDKRIHRLEQERADLLHLHEDQVQRRAEVPGLGVDSAQQIIAEAGAATKSKLWFSELKLRVELNRLRLRRLWNVSQQSYLAATAENLRRLVRFLHRGELPVTSSS